jgi:hypothetical protein
VIAYGRRYRGGERTAAATPVSITANTTYVVSYSAPAGNYAANNNYFATGVDNSPLHAPANGGAGANSVYRYGASGFPTNTYQASNYWVDVVFTSVAPPPPPPPPPNTPPTVSLTAPANGASFTAPASITMTANASDSNGTVAKVGPTSRRSAPSCSRC